MNCKECRERHTHEELPPVTRWEHEAAMAREQRANRHMFIICIILCVLLALSWIGFVVYENQFETVTETITTTTRNEEVMQGSGTNSYVGGDYYAAD